MSIKEQNTGGFERLLRSWSGRLLLALVSVMLFATANTLEFRGLFITSRDPDLFIWEAFWISQSIRWGLWALVALVGIVPLMGLARRWPLAKQIVAHGALALTAAWCFGLAWGTIRPELPSSIDFEKAMTMRQERRDQVQASSEGSAEQAPLSPEESPPPSAGRREDERRQRGERAGGERAGGERAGGERAGGERAGGERDGGERSARSRGPMGFDRRMERGPRNQSAGLLDRLLTHAFLLLLCGAGASYLRSQDSRRRVAKLSLERATLEAELGEARLSALESQLRPHFLFNALHSVGALVGAERNTEARAALVTLGDLLRLTLDRSSDGHSTLAQERDLCRSYLDLEKMRYGERLESTVKIPQSQENRSVPPLILLPLVENCVRHAVSKSSETVTIQLEASEAGEQLRLDVTCSQGSFPSDVLARGHGEGIGLANTRARLAAALGDTAQMQLENLPGGGTRVRLCLPLNTES